MTSQPQMTHLGAGQGRAAPPSTGRRDPRIDMLRGLSLLMIFIDHIPYNSLSRLTLRSFGFSDAAEIFVFLAGYSAFMAYPFVFLRDGAWAGCLKIGRRCLTIWGAHAFLLMGSLAILVVRQRLTGLPPTSLAPLIEDGLAGLLRGLTLQTLPAYLDVLPLYILLLASFPLVLFGLRRSVAATLVASLAIYAAAALAGWNLPNHIDSRVAATVWTFDPFNWQLVFVLGAVAAHGRCRGWRCLSEPPTVLVAACVGVLVFGFLAIDCWHLWPTVADYLFPRTALADEWKSTAPPWRVLHSLALLYLLLSSKAFTRFAAWPRVAALKACGRFSLQIFSAGCILALLGRIAFEDLGPRPPIQLAVNLIGVSAQLVLAWRLLNNAPERRAAPSAPAAATLPGVSA